MTSMTHSASPRDDFGAEASSLQDDAKPCPSCGAPLLGPYCAQCGERANFEPVPFGVWLKQTWASFAGLDSRLLRTLRYLCFSPGFLTNEYLQGRRIRYTKPLRLYIVISAVSIAVMSFFNALSLESWTRGADEPQQIIGLEDADDPEFRDRFDKRMNLIFPVINLLSPFIFCLLLKVLYRGPFLESHLVFSLHYFTAFVLIGLAPLPASRISPSAMSIVFLIVTVALTVYLVVAQKRVYGGGWLRHIPRLLVLSLGVVLISQALGYLTLVVTGLSL